MKYLCCLKDVEKDKHGRWWAIFTQVLWRKASRWRTPAPDIRVEIKKLWVPRRNIGKTYRFQMKRSYAKTTLHHKFGN